MSTPNDGQPPNTPDPSDDPADSEPDLLIDVRQALNSDHPLDLLAQASGLLAVVDPRNENPFEPTERETPTAEEIVASFIDIDLPETSGLLQALAALVDNDLLTARIDRELRRRDDALPAWLTGLRGVEVYRVVQMSHVLGDGDNLLLGARWPTGEELCGVVYIDHNVGTLVKDAMTFPVSLAETVDMYVDASGSDPDTTFTDIDFADARARITEAIETAAMTIPPFESDSWPMCRPLLEWLVRALPAEGEGYVVPEWSDTDRALLNDDFFTSSFGAPLDSDSHRALMEVIIDFGCEFTGGDPLRWSNVRVEMLLADWLPRKVLADPEFLTDAPDLLRAFIRYCHNRLDIRASLTDDTLTAVDEHEPDFLEALHNPSAHALAGNPLAELLESGFDGMYEQLVRHTLENHVGGAENLNRLDSTPLPDEPFVWHGVPDDIADTVAGVLGWLDSGCSAYFDTEVRTACRRLLHRAAVGDPRVFRRRARVETAAAGICWAVASGNDLFVGPERTMVKDVLGHFGVSSAQRAHTLMRAAGIDAGGGVSSVALGSPDLLTGAFRADLIERRDRADASGS